MLDRAFLETAEYNTLLASNESPIVVGRRGTGKSAIYYRLEKIWSSDKKIHLVRIAPDDSEMIALKYFIEHFGDQHSILKAASKIFFRYLLIVESASTISSYYKFDSVSGLEKMHVHLREWRKFGDRPLVRLVEKLKEVISWGADPKIQVGELTKKLDIEKLESELKLIISSTKVDCRILVDRIDEGYEASASSTAMFSGLSFAVVNANLTFENLRAFIFLRDNIVRSIAGADPDYTRSIEGRILRLHWDERSLFYLVCKRIRIAFNDDRERDLDVWNGVTSQDLTGRSGFRRCLRLTLYRPRDLLVLLNRAFFNAQRQGRDKIDNSDLEESGKEISENRMRDLIQEYSEIVVGIEKYVSAFVGRPKTFKYLDATRFLQEKLQTSDDARVSLHVELVGFDGVLSSLYSIGFLGLKSAQGATYVFSHDGKAQEVKLETTSELIVHPCYWMALGLSDHLFETQEGAQEIYDDMDIEISRESTETRNRRIGQLEAELTKIPVGTDGASRFEEWCEEMIRILFAGGVTNVSLHPNGRATQRRDVVATNSDNTPFWRRVLKDYEARQVVFEVKNFTRDLKAEEYRQMVTYLSGPYGRMGFIITRSEDNELRRGSELDWFKEIYHTQHRTIVKLTAKFLIRLLRKQRNTEKFSVIYGKMNGLIDRYQRNYLSLGSR